MSENNKTSRSKMNTLTKGSIRKYVLASIHLYGVIKMEDLLSLILYYERIKLIKDDVIPLVNDLIKEEKVTFKDDVIANTFFFDFSLEDEEDYENALVVLDIQSEKPRYKPHKAEFLNYADWDYIEPIWPLAEMINFIAINKLVEFNNIKEIVYDVLELRENVMYNLSLEEYFDYINDRGYRFKDEDQIQEFVNCIMNVQNNTRLIENNGHTPTELFEFMLQSSDVQH